VKYSILVFIISILSVSQVVAASGVKIDTPEKATKAISIYRQSRTSDVGFAAMSFPLVCRLLILNC